jgi:hypothetical protein
MSETWDDYTGTDTSAEVSALDSSAAETEAASDASFQAFDDVITGTGDVSSDLGYAANSEDWANWNAESASDWSDSADSYENAGLEALNSGDYESAQTDFANAESYADGASNYAETASDYADTADSWVQQASDDAAYDES